MKDLIKALKIFTKYQNVKWPTHCEHDILMIMDITEDEVSDKDKKQLDELDFFWSEEYECWASFRFGSA